jgi:hypothetical protein
VFSPNFATYTAVEEQYTPACTPLSHESFHILGCNRRSHIVEGAQQTQAADEVKPVPPTPFAIKKAELDQPTWDPAWDVMIEKALPGDLLSGRRAREVGSLCPRFGRINKGEKRAFWAYFFQALAGAEAGLRPTADVHHTEAEVDVADVVTHRPVHQEGLLQLTYMDSQRYRCDFDWEKDKDLAEHDPRKTILQPENNLFCGIKILESQVVTRREPLLSNQSYWSTLRPDNASFAVFKKQMASVPAVLRGGDAAGRNEPGADGGDGEPAAEDESGNGRERGNGECATERPANERSAVKRGVSG